MNRQLSDVFSPAVAFDLFFHAHLDLGHQQIGQFFFDPARIA